MAAKVSKYTTAHFWRRARRRSNKTFAEQDLCYRRQSLPKGQNAACLTFVSEDADQDNIKFYANFAKKRKRQVGEPDDAAALDEVAQEHVRYNLQHQGARSTVETPFA